MPRQKAHQDGQPAAGGKRAAIYCRVSTQAQAEDDKVSLAEQLADCEAYCQQHGYEVVERYQDVKSGSTSKRPDFQRLLAAMHDAAEAGTPRPFDVIICWKVDRLGRGLFPMARLLEATEPNGIGIEAVKEQVDQRYLGLFASVGKIELDNIKERTMSMRRARARQGYIPAANMPYGYIRGEDGKPAINEDEAAVLREATKRYVAGELPARIARDFRARNVPTRLPQTVTKQPWQAGYLNRLFRMAVYGAGQTTYGGETVTFPPILSPELYEAVQARRRLNTQQARRNTKQEYLLQHVLWCRECEMRFGATTRLTYIKKTPAGREQRTYLTPQRHYRCIGVQKYDMKCRPGPAVSATKVDAAVWEALAAALQEPETLLAGIRARLEALEAAAGDAELNEAERELSRLKVESLENARQRIRGKIDDARLDVLEAENAAQTAYWQERAGADQRLRGDIDAQRRTLEHAGRYLDGLRQGVATSLDSLPFAKRRELVLALVDRVWVDGSNTITIEGVLGGSGTNCNEAIKMGAAQSVPPAGVPFTLEVAASQV